MNSILKWIEKKAGKYQENSPIGKAISHTLDHWGRLNRFLADPKIPLDNNSAERSQRRPVMGRRNFQGFRTINGADTGMFFYTILASECEHDCVIEIADQGFGISDEKVAELCRSNQFDTKTQNPLHVLFMAGVSTASGVSLISGRGVGLSAIKNITEQLDGHIDIQRVEEGGLKIIMTIPKDTALSSRITQNLRRGRSA